MSGISHIHIHLQIEGETGGKFAKLSENLSGYDDYSDVR
jgi:hypothetical protein